LLLGGSVADSYYTLRARLGAHALHAKYDSRELTAKGRAKFDLRFLDEVDPDRQLPEAERLRRAEHAKRAYFTRLALKSAKARRKGAS
jgi:hypothetical protein